MRPGEHRTCASSGTPTTGQRQGRLDAAVGRGYLVEVQIADSARRHGILDEDILHALRNPLRVVAGAERHLVIAADRTGRLLEVVVLDDDPAEEPVVIHAMSLRPKFRDHLR